MQTALRWDPKVLEKIYKSIYSLTMKDKVDYLPMMYNIGNMTKRTESILGVGGEGLMEEWGESKNQVYYDDIDPLWEKVFRARKFSLGRQIERDFIDDLQVEEIKSRIRSLADAVYKTQQMQGVEFLNNGFDESGPNFRGRNNTFIGPDGKPLFAEDHPLGPNNPDTQSNLGTEELSIDSWNDTRVKMQRWKDDRGNLMAVIPDTLIVSPYNERAAYAIAGLPDRNLPAWEPDSPNFNPNIFSGHTKVIVNPFLTNDKAWFAADSGRMKQMNHWLWRRKIENGEMTDFDTEVSKFKAIGRWTYGFTHYSFIYGHNPS